LQHLTNFAGYLNCMRNTIFLVLFSVFLVSGRVIPATIADHETAGSGIGAGLGGVDHPGSW